MRIGTDWLSAFVLPVYPMITDILVHMSKKNFNRGEAKAKAMSEWLYTHTINNTSLGTWVSNSYFDQGYWIEGQKIEGCYFQVEVFELELKFPENIHPLST